MDNKNASDIVDAVDNLHRYTSQARAVISSIILGLEGNNLSSEVLANLAWIVGDRLDDIEKTTALIQTK